MRRGSSALRCKDSARRWSTRHSWPITDHTHPTWRATSLGDYRFWRDLGYAIGALLSGAVADFVGLGAAIHLVAALTFVSGLVGAWVTRKPRPAAIPLVA